MILKHCLLIENDCYKKNKKMTNNKPTGIVVHSTGANNKTLKRYVQPVPSQSCYKAVLEDLGRNQYGNHWNQSSKTLGTQICVHAFIGANARGEVETYQTLPFDVCCWGVGSGKNGSYNYNPQARIQFEICEDGLRDATYFNKAMTEAIEFCAYLCKKYNLSVNKISSHRESYLAGYGSNHGDPEHWMKKFGKDMNWFRQEVQKLLSVPKEESTVTPAKKFYRVQCGAFTVKQYAINFQKKLASAGFETFIVQSGKYWKIQCGAFTEKANAQTLVTKLKNKGFNAFVV